MYDHKTQSQKLSEIMKSGEKTAPKKVDIIDALSAIQSAYTKAGRDIPSFSDSMALIASQRSV